MKKIKIIIATHKKYRMPKDKIYIPLHVGAKGKENIGYRRDDTGDNISEKNPNYCELTGLYWAWKNLDADYIGLAHYRRHFSLTKKEKNPFKNVLTYKETESLLHNHKIILPKKRKYYIESLYSHYAHTHYAEHLDITRKIIAKMYPDYLKFFDSAVNKTYGYMFNMMIMPKEFIDDYCEWLFSILSKLEKHIISENLSSFQGRFYGRVSEIIFNVWLEKKLSDGIIKKSDIVEVNCIYMEKVDWKRKISSFLKAKFFSKKYEGSF